MWWQNSFQKILNSHDIVFIFYLMTMTCQHPLSCYCYSVGRQWPPSNVKMVLPFAFVFLSSVVSGFMPQRQTFFVQRYPFPSMTEVRTDDLPVRSGWRLKNSRRFLSGEENFPDAGGEKEEDEALYFDDFGDFVIGDDGDAAPPKSTPAPSWKNKLDERIKETQQQEIYRDTRLMQSWKQGDWSVRGFSLDPFESPSDTASNSDAIIVTKIAKDVNSDGERIWVGRSNGSLFWIQLGTEYTAHFKSNAKDGDSNLVRDASQSDEPPLERPFSLRAQFSPANSETTPLSSILSIEDYDCVFTACKGSARIHQWHISEDDIDSGSPTLKTPIPLSDGIHNGAVVALKTVTFKGTRLMLSVGDDGTLALWDISSADLVYHCQIGRDEMGELDAPTQQGMPTTAVNCADATESKIFLGTASGFVLGYDVADLMNSASTGSESCPLPQGRFKAHEGGVTAIACGGPGSLGRTSGDETASSVLLTGGGDGVVKQWEMLSSPTSNKMENWPKMSTQRLPKKAHLFEGHDAPITALESMGGRRPQFLSASADGTVRAWDATKGTEAYRMDGFSTDLTSLCLQGGSDTDDDLLITNGMKQYVCVHDFANGIGEDSIDDYYEQWDDNY